MGFLDFFSKKNRQPGEAPRLSGRELTRLGRLVESKLSQNYDRQEAIEQLGRMATPEAVSLLLKRFNWSMDPSITDQEEKEAAANGIRAAGEPALDPIREYCKRAESLTWPLKVLKDLVPEDRLVEELLSLLAEFDTEYVRNPEPKIQLITLLGDYPSEKVKIAVERFLADASEPVRFAAATALFAVNDPTSVTALVGALGEEESIRVKNRVAQGLAERHWPIPPELRPACKAALPPEYRLSEAEVVRAS
jgi:HEAT repeat protein